MANMYNIPELDERVILENIIIHNYSFGDLDKKYEGLTEATGNIFCPFHDNFDTPSAKAYYDEDRDIVLIFCFRERRMFTSFDFVERVLCRKRGIYKNPREFLEAHMSEGQLRELVSITKQNISIEDETLREKRVEYIENTYNKYDNVIEFIDSLYNELD